jgi:voltage-gated potassium channel Kch
VPAPTRYRSPAALQRTWRWLRWRTAAVIAVFACGFLAFVLGVGVSSRPEVAASDVVTKAYYTLGLFVLGGLDLGVPIGGPPFARMMLWLSYFAAPAITTSAVVEGVLRAIRPRSWALRRLRGHTVIAGCGKLTMQYLGRLREHLPRKPVVIVEARAEAPSIDEARDVYGAYVILGDITSDVLLATLRLEFADRVLLMTGDDFANLDAAAKVLALAPALRQKVVAHVSDLHFLRVLARTRLTEQCTIFNTHHIAAHYLVQNKLLDHFQRTRPLDTVVVAGFGRFGQTVLDALQNDAKGRFDRVVLIDLECTRRAEMFREQVGFVADYEAVFLDGDLRDPELWRKLDEQYHFASSEPAFVVGSGDDGCNMHTALWLKGKYPNAYVVARSFRKSRFAEEVSREGGFEVFAVAELLAKSIPDVWLG